MRRNCKSTLIPLQNLPFADISPLQSINTTLIIDFPDIQSHNLQKGNYCVKPNWHRIILKYLLKSFRIYWPYAILYAVFQYGNLSSPRKTTRLATMQTGSYSIRIRRQWNLDVSLSLIVIYVSFMKYQNHVK